jgi:hypothetical protein
MVTADGTTPSDRDIDAEPSWKTQVTEEPVEPPVVVVVVPPLLLLPPEDAVVLDAPPEELEPLVLPVVVPVIVPPLEALPDPEEVPPPVVDEVPSGGFTPPQAASTRATNKAAGRDHVRSGVFCCLRSLGADRMAYDCSAKTRSVRPLDVLRVI